MTKKSGATFAFEYYSQIDKKLIIEPRISGEANILFYPQRRTIQVGGECISDISFESKTGYSISGKVDPVTEGV